MRFVNSRAGRQLRLRGMNTRVVVPGIVRLGDRAAKAPAAVLNDRNGDGMRQRAASVRDHRP
jgi:hypothetical protein